MHAHCHIHDGSNSSQVWDASHLSFLMICIRGERFQKDNIRVKGGANRVGFLEIELFGDFLNVSFLVVLAI